MTLYPKYDISYWNSDGLEISKYYNKEGIIKRIELDPHIGKADYVSFCSNGSLILFSKSERKVFMIKPSKEKFSLVYELKGDMDWISIKMDKNNLYALDKKKQIDYLSFDEKLMKFNYICSYRFKCDKLRENSDFVIVELRKQHPRFYKDSIMVKMGIIGPFDNSKFIEVSLDSEYEEQGEIRIPAPKERPRITLNNCSLAFDDKNASLVIAEKDQNIIFEFYLGQGYSSYLCGGKAVQDEEGCNARDAYIKNLDSIVIYRPDKYIKKSTLGKASESILSIDKNGVRPRYLYFCSDDKLKKILDFPESARALRLSGLNKVYTLIGYVDQIRNDEETGEALLTSYVLNRPYSLSVSDKGEVCFLTDDYVYLMQPASFFVEEEIYRNSNGSGTDVS
jgi:hypothetical protein